MEIKEIYYKNGVEVTEADAPELVEFYHPTMQLLQVDTERVYQDPIDPYPSSHTYVISDKVKETREAEDVVIRPDPTTLEGAKALKVAECETWNASTGVCEFYLNDVPFPWIDSQKRSDLRNTLVDLAEKGVEVHPFAYKGFVVNLPVAGGIIMLKQLQLYASDTETLKEQRIIAINALESIEAVNAYDYKAGYPPKLNFPM